MASDQPLSKTEREALKAIYRATRAGAEAHTGDLAIALDVTPGTATAVVKKLAAKALADHRRYHGVELTKSGMRVAVSAIRRHRIVERFLSDMLGYPWHEADRLAPSFEHELPQEVEDRLWIALDRPATCPHGFPIPESKTAIIPELPPLYALEPGDVAIVAVPGSTEPDVVRFLDTLGLRPGVRITVKEKHPFDGPLVVRVESDEGTAPEDRTVGERLARTIYVRKESA